MSNEIEELKRMEEKADEAGMFVGTCRVVPMAHAREAFSRLIAERDALAVAIRDAAVKAGICRPDADLTGPMLTMLCADMGARLAELEQQKPIGWFQDVNRHNGQPPHYEHVADSHGGQDGTFQAFRLPVPATPADYTFPAGSMGAKKLEQLGGWEHWKPMGLVLHNNVESVAITEHGRVAWGDAPERPNSRLLAAARAVVARWETPLWKDAPATAGFIYELRDAIAACNESARKAVRLTAPDIVDALRGNGLYEDSRAFQRLFPILEADARAIESAVLAKNGIEVAE